MNMKLLKQLFKIYSPSGKEGYMTKFIKGFCKRIPDAKFEKDQVGNIYITRGESETYPCIVAHLDQVQKIHSKDSKHTKLMPLFSATRSSIKDSKAWEQMIRTAFG